MTSINRMNGSLGGAAARARVVLAKPGLDGHDRGIKIVARGLRDAGFEVVYLGRHQTPQQIVSTIVAEDADALGLSILSGAHLSLVSDIRDLMHSADIADVVTVVGGTIPRQDFAALESLGVHGIFTSGTSIEDIVRFFAAAVTLSGAR